MMISLMGRPADKMQMIVWDYKSDRNIYQIRVIRPGLIDLADWLSCLMVQPL
jgi:hypothetical protein